MTLMAIVEKYKRNEASLATVRDRLTFRVLFRARAFAPTCICDLAFSTALATATAAVLETLLPGDATRRFS